MALSNEDIAEFFASAEVRIVGNRSLREPQIEGHAAAVEFFAGGGDRAVEQVPVGCGKTGLISILPFGIARGRVLVIAPKLTIRDQIADAVDATNLNGFYRSAGVLTDLSRGPYRAKLDADATVQASPIFSGASLARRCWAWMMRCSADALGIMAASTRRICHPADVHVGLRP
jgi:DNA repair protein RadD